MLIAIAGAIGAGKSTVAKAVSERLGIPFHAIDDDKRRVGQTHSEFSRWVREAIPFPDDFREEVFGLTLQQLSQLADAHEHVIVEETFHRRAIREPFFEAAASVLGGVLLIEIEVDEEVAMAHLEKRSKEEASHMAGRAMYRAFLEVADPFDHVGAVVANNGALDQTVDEVCRFLTDRLGLPSDRVVR